MKRVVLLLLFVIFVPFSTTNAQSFNIPEGDFYIDLGYGDWNMRTENVANLPVTVLNQYYFSDSLSGKLIAIGISENGMSRSIMDMSKINIDNTFLNGFEDGVKKGFPGNSVTLNRGSQIINGASYAFVEFMNVNNPTFNSAIYFRAFSTIKKGKVIHFLFMYFNENSLNMGKQQDFNILKSIAFKGGV